VGRHKSIKVTNYRAVHVFKTAKTIQQVAALPFALRDGGFEVMMITARRDGRWILPKGWPESGEAYCDGAAREAVEEAGVEGSVHPSPVGDFTYKKVMRQGYSVPSQVFVFALQVRETHDSWPEKSARKRRWVSLTKAASLAEDAGLERFLRDLAQTDGAALHAVLAEIDSGKDEVPVRASETS
jgi:8-oxo-dGTP pyrophosphatase MutT (NUDIX family)